MPNAPATATATLALSKPDAIGTSRGDLATESDQSPAHVPHRAGRPDGRLPRRRPPLGEAPLLGTAAREISASYRLPPLRDTRYAQLAAPSHTLGHVGVAYLNPREMS